MNSRFTSRKKAFGTSALVLIVLCLQVGKVDASCGDYVMLMGSSHRSTHSPLVGDHHQVWHDGNGIRTSGHEFPYIPIYAPRGNLGRESDFSQNSPQVPHNNADSLDHGSRKTCRGPGCSQRPSVPPLSPPVRIVRTMDPIALLIVASTSEQIARFAMLTPSEELSSSVMTSRLFRPPR